MWLPRGRKKKIIDYTISYTIRTQSTRKTVYPSDGSSSNRYGLTPTIPHSPLNNNRKEYVDWVAKSVMEQ